ncbi:MAG: hypothetical protein HC767_11935 [Akkermansiaceae bacterium]|nr:hypothetical protein [Akkermansiaceae bacterium]
MLVDYSRENGLVQGAKDTFSGEKPCRLCRQIQSAEKQEKQNPLRLPKERLLKLMECLIRSKDISVPSPTFSTVRKIAFVDAALSAGIGPNAPPVPPPCWTA